jgi:hypothetical protein
MSFDISKVKSFNIENRFEKRIKNLKNKNLFTKNIEETVSETINNIFKEKCKSFVIYGAPQSGKTELLIALTAKLLDLKVKHILVLINDNVSLLNQNLDRFLASGLQPVPKLFKELEKSEINIKENQFIVFCKKNQSDLKKLHNIIGDLEEVFILDDEADYATPNSKINKKDESNNTEKSKINYLIERILGKNGKFIGVTATPQRLDLNLTFSNDNEKWVQFKPHPNYFGQEDFFPSDLNKPVQYKLKFLPLTDDDPKFLRDAFFRYLIKVAQINLDNLEKNKDEEYFSFLVHTSGRIEDHQKDEKVIRKTMSIIHEKKNKYESYLEKIFNACITMNISDDKCYKIIQYIKENIDRHKIVIMNSKKDMTTSDFKHGVKPIVPFTVCIGGNVVSRGVTFENLVSMFFTRSVKGKLQSDTYIQRARMFGNRQNVFKHFELSITEDLFEKWWEAFVFHQINLATLTGFGGPSWMGNSRIKAVAPSSIDKQNVEEFSNEISFGQFDFKDSIKNEYLTTNDKVKTLENLQKLIGPDCFPNEILNYVKINLPLKGSNIHFQNLRNIEDIKSGNPNYVKITREKGGLVDTLKDENIIHYFAIFYNNNNKARLFYKPTTKIKFLKRS